jgi:hypothetical protein
MRSPPGSDVMARLREFAWILKSRVRPFGHGHRGPPCQLIGAGIASCVGPPDRAAG